MRAFMSKPGDGPLYYLSDTLAYADGRTFAASYTLDAETVRLSQYAALAEARRILAETEPERDAEGWLTAHVPASFPEHGHTELAEALAAWLGEA